MSFLKIPVNISAKPRIRVSDHRFQWLRIGKVRICARIFNRRPS
jgi:hypothetical protein